MIHKKINGSYQVEEEINLGMGVVYLNIDESYLYYILNVNSPQIYIFFKCPSECITCSFPNNCSQCISGYHLNGGVCENHSSGNNNHSNHSNVCNRKCKKCSETKMQCLECFEFYVKNSQGFCEIENGSLSIFITIRPFLNILRRKGLKFLFLAIDDLWLYQYHKIKYDGTIREVFSTISFIQEKQWQIIGLGDFIE